jgi:hypothetical protein
MFPGTPDIEIMILFKRIGKHPGTSYNSRR